MTGTPFKGNPTPVFMLDHVKEWPADKILQTIARYARISGSASNDCGLGRLTSGREMNQSETIFVKRSLAGESSAYSIRSFTPYAEEPFCGHGLMSAAIMLRESSPEGLIFRTVEGIIVKAQGLTSDRSSPKADKYGVTYSMKLLIPAVPVSEYLDSDINLQVRIAIALKIKPDQILAMGRNSLRDIVIELDPEVDFSADQMAIDAMALMKACPPGTRSQIITGRGNKEGVDFLKRVFAYGSEGRMVLFFGTKPLTTNQIKQQVRRIAF